MVLCFLCLPAPAGTAAVQVMLSSPAVGAAKRTLNTPDLVSSLISRASDGWPILPSAALTCEVVLPVAVVGELPPPLVPPPVPPVVDVEEPAEAETTFAVI